VRSACGLGWVPGQNFHHGMGWVYGQIGHLAGLSLVGSKKLDPRTTLGQRDALII